MITKFILVVFNVLLVAFVDPAVVLGINGDLDIDVVFSNAAGEKNQVCLGDGFGGFTCSDVSSDMNNSRDVDIGFVDADNNLDVIFSNSGINRICLGDGSGGFSCGDVSTRTSNSWGVVLGLIDNDSYLDAVFSNANTRNRICFGNGSGGFTCSDVSADTNTSLGVALGYVDGDNDLDAIFCNSTRNRVCLGDGFGGFSCSDVSADTNISIGVALGYVNGDNNLDAVFTNAEGETNRVCLGDGSGGFSCSDVSADTSISFGVALGYVDGDNNLDAVFSNVNASNRVCFGNGSGGFTCTDVSTDTNTSRDIVLSSSPDNDRDGYSVIQGDCNDNDASLNPGTYWYQDSDVDGYGDQSIFMRQCTMPSGTINFVLNKLDYDDYDSHIGPPTKIGEITPSYYLTLQEAYDAAGDGDTIQSIDGTFTEDLFVDIGKSIVLEGGYDGVYSVQSGYTTLNGSVDVTNGTLTIGNFILKQ